MLVRGAGVAVVGGRRGGDGGGEEGVAPGAGRDAQLRGAIGGFKGLTGVRLGLEGPAWGGGGGGGDREGSGHRWGVDLLGWTRELSRRWKSIRRKSLKKFKPG